VTTEALRVYVADHLAGSATGVSLARRVARRFRGTPAEPAFAGLVRDVQADRRALQDLARALGIGVRPLRQACGWAAAQLARVRYAVSASRDPGLGRLQELESMALGILGKLSLWEALHAATAPGSLGPVPIPDLVVRARQQHALVEQHRLDLALAVFGHDPDAAALPS
jgi:hypothetical protein